MASTTALTAFDLDISRPADAHTYHIDAVFWSMFEHSLIEEGTLTVVAKATRSPSEVIVTLAIQGTIALVCDRSLEAFDYPIALNKEITFRLGYENKEIDEDLYVIEQGTTSINLAQHLYDFISLAVPMKKVHPCFSTDKPLI